VLQGHPNGWDAERFEQFENIVDFLQERGAVFLTPTELRDRIIEKI
jgi:peptidoglycan/xylan/chitin deacetylase (PgdA/CDA1 family)